MRVESCRRVSAVWYDDIMYPYQDHLEWNRDVLYYRSFAVGPLRSWQTVYFGMCDRCRCQL